MSDYEGPAEHSRPEGRSHPWYDDDFCKGGGTFVGTDEPQVECPVCGEMMNVDEEGNLFKHRPHIPKSV